MCSMCVQKGRDREMFNLCIVFVCWDEFEQAGEFGDAHGVGWRVEGVGLWSGGFPVVLDASGPEPECHIPFSG